MMQDTRRDKPGPNRAILIGVLVVIAAGGLHVYRSRGAPTPPGWREDVEPALKEAKLDNKPVLVDFVASWCGPCQQMMRDVLPNPKVVEAMDGFVTVKADVDQYSDLANEHEVQYLPTFVVLDGQGREVHRFTGYHDVDDFLLQIAAARQRLAA